MCTRAVGGLGHYLESEGVPTTQISLVREHTERIRPPRALWVPYDFGRPFGAADDPALQRRVLEAALALLEVEKGPVLEDFPDAGAQNAAHPDGSSEGWACPIPLRSPATSPDEDSLRRAFLDEFAALRPWYELAVSKRGRTTVGGSGLDLAAAAEFVAAFAGEEIPDNPCPEIPIAFVLRAAVADLKAAYIEAVTAQPGDTVPTHAQLADWFWRETRAAELLFELKRRAAQSQDRALQLVTGVLMIPMARTGG